jgi:hypothetical protein
MNGKKILSIDEFVEFINSEKNKKQNVSPQITEEEKPQSVTSKPIISIKAGDFVEDRYGNRYVVTDVTTNYKVADAIDDWDQISKFKDRTDVIFVIVWAKEEHTKKLVFVFGIDDDNAVRKVISKSLSGEDELTKIFKAACEELEDSGKLDKFKNKWRIFIDKVRTGKITNERHVMAEILDDFGLNDLLRKSKMIVAESVSLDSLIGDNVYTITLDGETCYICPKTGETDTTVYKDEKCKDAIKKDNKDLTVKIKTLFNIDKYLAHATTTDEPTDSGN